MIFSKDKSTIGEPVNESVRRNGYMALDMQSFDIRSVYFLNIKKNNIISTQLHNLLVLNIKYSVIIFE